MEFDEDFEYCGDCPVCNNPVDHSDAGFCVSCGLPFHWDSCGGWEGQKHTCNGCKEQQPPEEA